MELVFPGRLPLKRQYRVQMQAERVEPCGQHAQDEQKHFEISQRKTRRVTGGLAGRAVGQPQLIV
jgi:hypothetical protein